MAKRGEQLTYTTFEGRTITNVDVLLRDPGSRKGYITVPRYRKPE